MIVVNFSDCVFSNVTFSNVFLRDLEVDGCIFNEYIWAIGKRQGTKMVGEEHDHESDVQCGILKEIAHP